MIVTVKGFVDSFLVLAVVVVVVHWVQGGTSHRHQLYVLTDNLMRFSGLHSKQGRDHFWAWKGDDHSTKVSSVRKIEDALHRTKLLKIDPDVGFRAPSRGKPGSFKQHQGVQGLIREQVQVAPEEKGENLLRIGGGQLAAAKLQPRSHLFITKDKAASALALVILHLSLNP